MSNTIEYEQSDSIEIAIKEKTITNNFFVFIIIIIIFLPFENRSASFLLYIC